MSNKKYVLTNETINYDGRILHRIKAIKDFNDVKKGDLGGWIESEENLSQEGNCWIYNDAEVYGYAKVHGHAIVYGYAEVYGNAEINKSISNTSMYFTIGPIGSRDDTTTFIKTDDTIHVNCGCFSGTIDEFTEKVLETHGDNKHAKDYTDAIHFVLKKFGRVKEIIKIPLLNNIGEPNINGVILSEEAFEKYINSDYYKELIDTGRLFLTYGGTSGEFLDKITGTARINIMNDYIIGKVESIDRDCISIKVIANESILNKCLKQGFKAYLTYQAIKKDDNIIKDMKIMYCSIGPDIMKGVTNDD